MYITLLLQWILSWCISPYYCSAWYHFVYEHHPTIAVHHLMMYITQLLQCIIWTLPQLEQSSVDRQKQGSTRVVGLLDCIIGDCLHIDVLMSNSCLLCWPLFSLQVLMLLENVENNTFQLSLLQFYFWNNEKLSWE